MALEREFERLRERTGRFKEFHERVENAAHSRPFLIPLEVYSERMASQFAVAIENRLTLIQKVKDLDLSVAASATRNIERGTDRFLRVLGLLLQRVDAIPGELVEFTGWCLQQAGQSPPAFAIATDDKVAMYTLREIAEQNGFKEAFPEFFELFDESPIANFVLLLLPDQLMQRSSSLNWCVLAHEVGHAYLERTHLIANRFPSMPTDWTAIRWQAEKGDDETKKEARWLMQLTEYACDEIAVRLTGCAFVWRLLTDFFSLEQLSSSMTHPPVDKRVRRAAELARELGFQQEAAQLLAQLEQETRDASFGTPDEIRAEELLEVSTAIKAAIPAVTASQMLPICENHAPALTLDEARLSLREGKPVALPAWVIMCLATPDEALHSSPGLQEVIADSIRLGQVAEGFMKVTRASPA